jgi:hypothetical protein
MKRIRIIILTVVGLAVAFIAVQYFLVLGMFAKHERDTKARKQSFSSPRWKAQTDGEDIRVWMVDDLIERKLLVGKTREQVLDLLGPFFDRPDDQLRRLFPEWDMYYYLGVSRALFEPLDLEYLVLRLDEENRVIAVSVVKQHL